MIASQHGTPLAFLNRPKRKKLTQEQREARLKRKARQVRAVYQAAHKEKQEALDFIASLEELRRRMEALARLQRNR